MKIECKLISFQGKKEHENDFEFELNHDTAIASTEHAERSIVMIHGSPYTINIPFAKLRKYKQSIVEKHGKRNRS